MANSKIKGESKMPAENKVPQKKLFPSKGRENDSVEPKQEDECCHKHHCCSGEQDKVDKVKHLYLLLIAVSIIFPIIGFMFGLMATSGNGYCYYMQ